MGIVCLSKEAKLVFIRELERLGAREEDLRAVQELPACRGGVVEFGEGCQGGRERKGKRQASPRAQFVGQCIREEHGKGRGPVPELMKECSRRWRERKGG